MKLGIFFTLVEAILNFAYKNPSKGACKALGWNIFRKIASTMINDINTCYQTYHSSMEFLQTVHFHYLLIETFLSGPLVIALFLPPHKKLCFHSLNLGFLCAVTLLLGSMISENRDLMLQLCIILQIYLWDKLHLTHWLLSVVMKSCISIMLIF